MTSGERKQFLDPQTLDEAAIQLKDIADKCNAHIALVGGFALQFFGSDRLTGDIDIISDKEISELPALESLSFGGYVTKAPNGTPVDIVIRNDDYQKLYEEALLHAIQSKESKIPLVPVEYLAAMKMAAGRRKDLADLEFLIVSKAIDIHKTRAIIKHHLGPYAAREFDTFVQTTLWQAALSNNNHAPEKR